MRERGAHGRLPLDRRRAHLVVPLSRERHRRTGHLVRLTDGRLVCVYGYRRPPSGVRFRVSDDDGDSWGREWILREDGANFDLGYPRAVELDDGRLLTAYYYNVPDESIPMDGGPRYIAATTFEVPD